LRRTKRRANDLTASKHVVKTVGECLVSLSNQDTERFWAFGQWSALMKEAVASLTEDDMLALAAYTASRKP
jgi:hypothetical protein